MFYGSHLSEMLKRANERENESTIFGYQVKDPRAYGVVEIDEHGKAISIEEINKLQEAYKQSECAKEGISNENP